MARKAFTAPNVSSSGPYSHAIDAGDFYYFSGQTAKNAVQVTETNREIAAQTEKCFENIQHVMDEVGVTMDDVVKVTVYLTAMKYFAEMNAVYATKFAAPFPARTCVAVYELPLGADVEIEVIVKKP